MTDDLGTRILLELIEFRREVNERFTALESAVFGDPEERKRALTRERVRRHRNAKSVTCNASNALQSVTDQVQPALQSVTSDSRPRDNDLTLLDSESSNPLDDEETPEKRKNPPQAPPKSAVVTLPESLISLSGFSEAWAEWEQHRREIKKPLTPTARVKELAFLGKRPRDALAIIEISIRQGWQGLFELKHQANGKAVGDSIRDTYDELQRSRHEP